MALDCGLLTVTVEAARDLKDPEWVGRQDPYCVIRVGGQTFRTRTAVDGGRNPVWNETFRFNVPHPGDDVLEVVLKDDQLIEHDATLGAARIPLAKAREMGADRVQAAAVISPRHHRQHGAVSLALQWEQSHEPMQQHPVQGPDEQQQGQPQHRHHHGGGTPRERVDVVEFVEQRPAAAM
ncbi:hypothetical protein HXX76_009059 [Chlamydomonas incerta]|uniref:C2 domain-containing protein n=1 Tax=Chlamydomonas incerta TaxID=51695 RepID=A0A835W001_CHLIN|nr:hypothetical protein HXX76_009059 [Chlamydomonas incerta]|eukprot:KAG2432133.1 hypothetical protein HXX76_009059 [Chlamydomonas incerta]